MVASSFWWRFATTTMMAVVGGDWRHRCLALFSGVVAMTLVWAPVTTMASIAVMSAMVWRHGALVLAGGFGRWRQNRRLPARHGRAMTLALTTTSLGDDVLDVLTVYRYGLRYSVRSRVLQLGVAAALLVVIRWKCFLARLRSNPVVRRLGSGLSLLATVPSVFLA